MSGAGGRGSHVDGVVLWFMMDIPPKSHELAKVGAVVCWAPGGGNGRSEWGAS